MDATGADTNKAALRELLERDDNTICADCRAPAPQWASASVGCFICTQCAGVHRSLGVHVSFVLSVQLDAWSDAQVATMSQRGNGRVNSEYEYHVPVYWPHPSPEQDRDYREQFIRAKYSQRFFCAERAPTAPAGADGGETPMRAAARPRQSSFVMRPLDLEAADGGFKSPEFASPTVVQRKIVDLGTPRGGPGTPRTPRGGGEPDEATSSPAPVPPPLRPPQPAVGAGKSAPSSAASSGVGMVEYCGVLSLRVVRATGLAGGQASFCAVSLGAQRLRTSLAAMRRETIAAAVPVATPRRCAVPAAGSHAAVWNEVVMLCWNGADALRLQLRSATAGGFLPDGHLGSCAVMLDGLPPQEATALEIDLGEEVSPGDVGALGWRRCLAPEERARASSTDAGRATAPPAAEGGGGLLARLEGALMRCVASATQCAGQRPQGQLVVEVTFEPIPH